MSDIKIEEIPSHDRPLNKEQLLFGMLVAKGESLIDAYAKAYDKPKTTSMRANASRLAADLRVKDHIQQCKEKIKEEFAQHISYGLKEAMRESDETFELARRLGQPSVMNAVTKTKAQLKGLLIQKAEEEKSLTVEDATNRLKELFSHTDIDAIRAILDPGAKQK